MFAAFSNPEQCRATSRQVGLEHTPLQHLLAIEYIMNFLKFHQEVHK